MPPELSWPNSNRPHHRTCSPKLTSPVILLVDDANTQPTQQLYQEEPAAPTSPERRGQVDIWLLKSRVSSTVTAPPMERESLYEDDIPDSGDNTSSDESPPEKPKDAKKASIPLRYSRAHGRASTRRQSNARYRPRRSNPPESVYSIAPPGTAPPSPGPSRESAYSAADESGTRPVSRPAGKPQAYYSLANLERFASPPPTTTTFPEAISSASCWPAPLQPLRNSGSTTTRGSESRSDAELSRRTSATTTSSLSLRNSATRSSKPTRPSSASQRASLPPEERSLPRRKASRGSDNRQTGGWPSLTRSGVDTPISERTLSPRTVISRDSLPVAEASWRPGRRAPPGGLSRRVSGQGSWMATGSPRLKERSEDWCDKCYGYQAGRIGGRDRSKDRETVKKFRGDKDAGLQTRCVGRDGASAGRRDGCFEDCKRVVTSEGAAARHKTCPEYRRRVVMSVPEGKIAEWQVEHGSNDVPPGLVSQLAAESVAGLFPWGWI